MDAVVKSETLMSLFKSLISLRFSRHRAASCTDSSFTFSNVSSSSPSKNHHHHHRRRDNSRTIFLKKVALLSQRGRAMLRVCPRDVRVFKEAARCSCLRVCLKAMRVRIAFSYAGPAAWNSLPDHIQSITNTASFKRQLKTFLFSACSYY